MAWLGLALKLLVVVGHNDGDYKWLKTTEQQQRRSQSPALVLLNLSTLSSCSRKRAGKAWKMTKEGGKEHKPLPFTTNLEAAVLCPFTALWLSFFLKLSSHISPGDVITESRQKQRWSCKLRQSPSAKCYVMTVIPSATYNLCSVQQQLNRWNRKKVYFKK